MRRVRRRTQQFKDDDLNDSNKPHQPKKKSRRTKSGKNFASNPAILEGLEDDVIEMREDMRETNLERDQLASDISQRELLGQANQPFESVPTDKFYLEMENKFTIQNKNLYEKKREERMRQINEAEKNRMLREELKFQISTPKTALKTHKVLRVLFLLIHGINVGFLIWQTIVVYFVNLSAFTLNLNSVSIPSQFSYFYLYQDITMPIHCLSYFFLTICIVDCMDRYIFFNNCFFYLVCPFSI